MIIQTRKRLLNATTAIDLIFAKAKVNDNNKKSLFKDVLFYDMNSGGKINQ